MTKVVVMEKSDVTLAQIKDFFRQIEDGSIVRVTLQAFLEQRNPFKIPTDPIKQWELFYTKFFGMKMDFPEVSVPINPSDFSQIIFMAEGLDYDMVEKACKRFFGKFWKWNDKPLSELIDMRKETRTTKYSYAICVRDFMEADEVHKNKSAEMLLKEGINGQTLLERLVHGMFVFWVTGKHLDFKNVTLCTGSRFFGGGVPYVHRYSRDGSVSVLWHLADNRYGRLRVREAVS